MARIYIWKDQLPMLYEMLEDANYNTPQKLGA